MIFLLLYLQLPPEVLELALAYEQAAHVESESGWELDEQPLLRLEQDLAPWLFSEKHRQKVGQLLADYWRNLYEIRQIKLQPFGEPSFNGFYASHKHGGLYQRILFSDGLLYRSGRPFADGDLLWFDHQQLALKKGDALKLVTLPFKVAPGSTYLEFEQMLDADLFNFLFGQLDRAFIMMGKPQRLDGRFFAESPEMLLNQLIVHFGYSLIMDAKIGFVLLRPGFDTSSLEQALKHVNISDRGGYLSGGPLLEAQKESFSFSQWLSQNKKPESILDNYAVGYEIEGQYQLVRLSESSRVVMALLSFDMAEDPCDYLERFINNSCQNRKELIPKLRSRIRSSLAGMNFSSDLEKTKAESYLKCL